MEDNSFAICVLLFVFTLIFASLVKFILNILLKIKEKYDLLYLRSSLICKICEELEEIASTGTKETENEPN